MQIVRQMKTYYLLFPDGGMSFSLENLLQLWMRGEQFLSVDPEFPLNKRKSTIIVASDVHALDRIVFLKKTSPRKVLVLETLLNRNAPQYVSRIIAKRNAEQRDLRRMRVSV